MRKTSSRNRAKRDPLAAYALQRLLEEGEDAEELFEFEPD
jgi:hypothetical protein